MVPSSFNQDQIGGESVSTKLEGRTKIRFLEPLTLQHGVGVHLVSVWRHMARVVFVAQQVSSCRCLSQSLRSVVVLVMATLFGTTTATSTSNNGSEGDVFGFLFGSTATVDKGQADLHRTKRSKGHDIDNNVIMPPVTTRSRPKRRSKKYTRPIFKEPLNLPSSTTTVSQEVAVVDDSHDSHHQRGPNIIKELFGGGTTAPTAGDYSEGREDAIQPSYNASARVQQLMATPSERRFSLNHQYTNDDQGLSGGGGELEKGQRKASSVYPRLSYRNGPSSSRPAYGRSYSSPLYSTQLDDESVVTVSDLDNLAAKSLRSRKSVSSRASYARKDRNTSNCCGSGGVGEGRISDLTMLREEIAEMVGSMDQDEDNLASAAAAFCRDQRDTASALRRYFVFDRQSNTKDRAEVETKEDSRGLHHNMWSDMQSYWVCKCACMDV